MLKYTYTIISLIIAIGIFGASSLPKTPLPKVRHIDKIAHFIAFGILAGTTLGALKENRVRSRLPLWILSVIIASLWGAIDEIHQMYVPGRKSSLNDWIADTLGGLLVCFILQYLSQRKREE